MVSSATGRRARLALERLSQSSYDWLTSDICGPLAYRRNSNLNGGFTWNGTNGSSNGVSTSSPPRPACVLPLISDPKIRSTTLLTAFLLAFPYQTISKPKAKAIEVDTSNNHNSSTDKVISSTTIYDNETFFIDSLNASEHLLSDVSNLSGQMCFTDLTPGTRNELTALSNILSQLVAIRRPQGVRCKRIKEDEDNRKEEVD